MRIIVQKFGGSSLADVQCMRRVQTKVAKALASGCKVIAVLSAQKGETNRLLDLANEWSSAPDPEELDVLISTGEQTSVALFSMLLKDANIKCRSLLGHQIQIKTNEEYGKARIKSIDDMHLFELFKAYDVLVVAGFQGITENGKITTLGRGGSDTSAVAIAAAVKAELCEIYTDVEGIYTTDPNICPQARKLDTVCYEEMLEMASLGAKVLEIRSVEFAKKFNIPLVVRSTFSDAPGTRVINEDEKMEQLMISSVAYDKNQARITLRSVPDKPGIASAIFTPLSDAGLSVDMIVQNPSRGGVTDMSFTITRQDLKRALTIVEKINNDIGGIEVLYDDTIAKISVIGVGMRNHSGVAAKAFNSLLQENINIIMISTSEIKISCIIEEKYTELAVRTWHNAFGLDKVNTPINE